MSVLAAIVLAVLSIPQMAIESASIRVAVSDQTNALGRFVGYPSGAANDRFTLNPKFWARGVDFSCVSPWNSASGNLRAGTLVSKRHIVYASHFPLAIGTRLSFVDEKGMVCPCRLTAGKVVPGTDIMVGLLDYEVTPNIRPAKILPPDFEKYIGRDGGMPTVVFNQREELLLWELKPAPTNMIPRRGMSGWYPKNKAWKRFNKSIVVGDSGNPAFLLVGDSPIFTHCAQCAGTGGGPPLHSYRKEVQKVMDELCPGYKLEVFDFSQLKSSNEK